MVGAHRETSMSILYGKQQGIYCHRRFLPHNHRYRKNIKNFFVGRVEKNAASPRLSGEELHDVI
jgi:hypothetical protein